MSINYGKQVNTLKSNSETAANNLKTVIKSCSQYLIQQQVYSKSLSKLIVYYLILFQLLSSYGVLKSRPLASPSVFLNLANEIIILIIMFYFIKFYFYLIIF